jgi:hypothetical protein
LLLFLLEQKLSGVIIPLNYIPIAAKMCKIHSNFGTYLRLVLEVVQKCKFLEIITTQIFDLESKINPKFYLVQWGGSII